MLASIEPIHYWIRRRSPWIFSLDEVDLGLVVSLETLREVLKSMSIHGRRWWIASDPDDAIDTHTVTIGHGDPGCHDRLNTLYYRVPVLNEEPPMAGSHSLRLLLDSSVVLPEQPGMYFEGGRVLEDSLADLQSFFDPIQRALLVKLQSSVRGQSWDMRKDLEQKFKERWPTWFNLDGSPLQTSMAWGFAHGDGWFDLVWRLCEQFEPIVLAGDADTREWEAPLDATRHPPFEV
jgi:hypothetical protein